MNEFNNDQVYWIFEVYTVVQVVGKVQETLYLVHVALTYYNRQTQQT